MPMPSVETMIERIMDAYDYEEFLELLFSWDDVADIVSQAIRDIVEDDDSDNEDL